MIDNKFILGAAIGVGALLLVPGVARKVGRAARPMVKAAAKTGAVAYKEFREAGAEAYEHVEDIFAEVHGETSEAMQNGGAGTFADEVAQAFDDAATDRSGG